MRLRGAATPTGRGGEPKAAPCPIVHASRRRVLSRRAASKNGDSESAEESRLHEHTESQQHGPEPRRRPAPKPQPAPARAQPAPSARQLLALQQSAGNQAVQRAVAGEAPLSVQRKTGATGYKKLLKGKNVPAADTGTIADASIAVAVKDEIRTKSEKGHGWIEIELRQPWSKLDPATKQQLEANMGDPTKRLLPTGGYTSVGFYPKDPSSKTATIATAGKMLEPEKAYMLANTTAKMTFPVGVKALGKLLKFVRAAEASPPIYSFLVNNCTTWAVDAIKQVGKNASSFLGKVTSRTVTAPGKF